MAISYKAGKPESADFLVPAGEYKLRVVDAKEDTSKGGNDMIELKLTVLGETKDGPHLFDHLVFTPGGQWKVDQFLAAAGMHPGEGADVTVSAQDLLSAEVEAQLKVEEFDGVKRNKVVRYIVPEF